MVAWMACSTVVMKGLARWCVDGMLDSCDEGWLLFEKGRFEAEVKQKSVL